MKRVALLAAVSVCLLGVPAVQATIWEVSRHETFDSPGSLNNLQTFGEGNWLTAEIRNEASLTVTGGLVHFETTDFPGQALLRITDSLPDEYKIQVRLGNIDFSYLAYDDDDYDDSDFAYDREWVENGFYWGILSDVKCEGEHGEQFWHNHRKLGMDSDDHYSDYGSEHTQTPLYMVYSNKFAYEDLPVANTAYEPDGGLKSTYLSSWPGGGSAWDYSTWSWEIAHTYSSTAWYWTEIEKSGDTVVLRLYDANKNLIEESAPIDQELVFNMGGSASPEEYFYLGEPHVDSYEGSAYVDEIILYTPVPEPAGAIVLTLGLLGAVRMRRRVP